MIDDLLSLPTLSNFIYLLNAVFYTFKQPL